jgi:hypothetical protein
MEYNFYIKKLEEQLKKIIIMEQKLIMEQKINRA